MNEMIGRIAQTMHEALYDSDQELYKPWDQLHESPRLRYGIMASEVYRQFIYRASPSDVREAVDRYRRVKAGENCYRVYMPERFDERGIVFKPWRDTDEREYLDRRRADIELLAASFVDKWIADGAAKDAEVRG